MTIEVLTRSGDVIRTTTEKLPIVQGALDRLGGIAAFIEIEG